MHKLDDSLGYLLNVAAGINKNVLYSVLAPYEITPEQFIILAKLDVRGDGKTQRQLAVESYKDEANITRILKKLELKGYVNKVSDNKDKRNNLVFITKEGHSLIEALQPSVIEYRKRMFQNLSKEEVFVVETILKKIIDNSQ